MMSLREQREQSPRLRRVQTDEQAGERETGASGYEISTGEKDTRGRAYRINMRTMQAIFCKKLPSAELTDNGPLTREQARDLQHDKEIEKFCESVSRSRTAEKKTLPRTFD
jgi:hypothetical protein